MNPRHLLHLLFLFLAVNVLPLRVRAQAEEIQQLLLNVEKLNQLRSVLSNMKQGYEVLHKGYNTVRDITENNFSLHETFLDGLLAVNPHLHQYSHVADILTNQQRLVREYKHTYALFRQYGHFSTDELEYLGAVYAQLLSQSTRHLDELALVLTAGTLRMSDNERLEAIDRIHTGMEDKLAFLRHFNRQTTLLALQRASERRDLQAIKQLYPPTL